jgi:nucleoside phosphorylase
MAQKTRPSHRKQDIPRRWLVLSAWDLELVELRRLLKLSKSSTVTTACAGVGLVEAAMGAALLIARNKPDAVLFLGTAGLYKGRVPGVDLGGVVAARELRLWSANVASGRAYFPAPLPATLQPTAGLLGLAERLGLPLASVACPLGISTQAVRSSRVPRKDAPDVENLEAFAVGRAATRLGLPFMAILGISNRVGAAAHAQWKKHAQTAAAAACRTAYTLMAESRRPVHLATRGQ